MTDYELSIDLEVMHRLFATDEEKRQTVIDVLVHVRRNPFLKGDLQEIDDTGRVNEVVVVGDVLVFFWSDHAVKAVRVTKVEFVEGD